MRTWKSWLIPSLVIIMGLAVILSEAGILVELGKIRVNKLINPLVLILYVAALVLVWLRYRLESTSFYQWLAMALVFKVGLILESFLFRWLFPPLLFVWEQPGFYKLISFTHHALQQGGEVLFVVLLVYALGQYDTRVKFTTVFKPPGLAIIILTLMAGLAINFYFLPGINQPNLAVFRYLIIKSLVAGICIYGLVLAWPKMKVYGNTILKGLVLFLAIHVVVYLISFIDMLLFILWQKPVFPMVSIHFLSIITLVLPVLLVAGLIADKYTNGTDRRI